MKSMEFNYFLNCFEWNALIYWKKDQIRFKAELRVYRDNIKLNGKIFYGNFQENQLYIFQIISNASMLNNKYIHGIETNVSFSTLY